MQGADGYFDENATAPISLRARAVFEEAITHYWQNPSSPYRSAARVHAKLEACRKQLAGFFGQAPERVLFNSGATEGNHLLLAWAAAKWPEASLLLSPIEHPSVLEPARHYFGEQRLRWLSVNEDGCVDPATVSEALASEKIALVSLQAANNETGVLQDIEAVSAACRKAGVPLHSDATQWIGKLPLAPLAEVDFLTACSHKFGGIRGSGFLLHSDRFGDFHSLLGGGQEQGKRAGTESLPLIASLVEALSERLDGLPQRAKEGAIHRDAFEEKISERLPELKVHGQSTPRLWNTSSMCLPGHVNTRWLRRLDKLGFAVSTGSACSTGKEHPSHVLSALGVSPEDARRTLRFSACWEAREEDWQTLADSLLEVWEGLCSDQPGPSQVIDL